MERYLPISITPGAVATVSNLNVYLESAFYIMSIVVLSLTTYRYMKNMKFFKAFKRKLKRNKK